MRILHLARTGFDAKATPVAFANLGTGIMHIPCGEQEFLPNRLAVFAIPMPTESHENQRQVHMGRSHLRTNSAKEATNKTG